MIQNYNPAPKELAANRVAECLTDGNGAISETVYKPLSFATEEIRLLVLHPPLATDPTVRCTLSHTTLSPSPNSSTLPKYEALSYVWGKPDLSTCILLNGQTYFVTPRLEYILLNLRYKNRDRVLWVDALCICQSDVEERNQQVALMRKIYSRCQRVLAWLGLPEDPVKWLEKLPAENRDSHRAWLDEKQKSIKHGMDLMHRITEKDPQTLKSLEDQFAYRLRLDKYFRMDVTGQSSRVRLLTESDEQALREIFSIPEFWDRIWIVQELSLAPRVTLVCEGAELAWESVSTFLRDEPYFDAFHTLRYSHGNIVSSETRQFRRIFFNIKSIEDQRRIFMSDLWPKGNGNETSSTLLDVLTRFREKVSTDPRDKVYGLLALVTQEHGIEIDYTKSVSDVYRETTLALINQCGNLDILCQSQFERRNGSQALLRNEDLSSSPSWAAEIDIQQADSVPILFAQRDIFNAGTKHCAVPCRTLGEKLILKGSILGCIGRVFQAGSEDTTDKEIMQFYLGTNVLENAENHQYSPSIGGVQLRSKEPETAAQAYWRTLAQDCTAPPRMRRLNKAEILALDCINQSHLNSGQELRTVRIPLDDIISKSAFAYIPKDNTLSIQGEILEDQTPIRFDATLAFTMTDNGLFLLTRSHAQQGDIIAVLDGGKTPMVLRKVESKHEGQNSYQLVCPAYVHGLMDGEAEEAVAEGYLVKQDLFIV